MSKFKVGDRVRVRKPADVDQEPGWSDEMDKFDGTVQEIREVHPQDRIVRFVGDRHWWAFHFDWLEPVKPKTLKVGDPVEPIRSWVPEGYIVIEMAVPNEMAQAIGEGNALVFKCPKKGDRHLFHPSGPAILSDDFERDLYPVIVPTTPASKYRKPTQADVGKMVEVSDCRGDSYEVRELLAVIIDESVDHRFICRDVCIGKNSLAWRFARIKIEESK